MTILKKLRATVAVVAGALLGPTVATAQEPDDASSPTLRITTFTAFEQLDLAWNNLGGLSRNLLASAIQFSMGDRIKVVCSAPRDTREVGTFALEHVMGINGSSDFAYQNPGKTQTSTGHVIVKQGQLTAGWVDNLVGDVPAPYTLSDPTHRQLVWSMVGGRYGSRLANDAHLAESQQTLTRLFDTCKTLLDSIPAQAQLPTSFTTTLGSQEFLARAEVTHTNVPVLTTQVLAPAWKPLCTAWKNTRALSFNATVPPVGSANCQEANYVRPRPILTLSAGGGR